MRDKRSDTKKTAKGKEKRKAIAEKGKNGKAAAMKMKALPSALPKSRSEKQMNEMMKKIKVAAKTLKR
jgi:hypothetical protein